MLVVLEGKREDVVCTSAGKGNNFVCRRRGKGTRLFVDVQGKGRDSIFILFPEHLQTILFPSLYIYKQSCSLSLHNYKQTCSLFPPELRARSTTFLKLNFKCLFLSAKSSSLKTENEEMFYFFPSFTPLHIVLD